jgi:hypothetical protein
MTEQIEIPLSKNKLILALMGSIVFVGIGLWFVFLAISKVSQAYISLVGLATIIFFGTCAVFIGKKIGDKTPGLVINKQGILDNSSGVAAGLVLWTDMNEIKLTNVAGQRFIMLIVKNPEEYINRQKGFIKKKSMWMNHRFYGSPISIGSNGLKYNFYALHTTIQNKFKENKV